MSSITTDEPLNINVTGQSLRILKGLSLALNQPPEVIAEALIKMGAELALDKLPSMVGFVDPPQRKHFGKQTPIPASSGTYMDKYFHQQLSGGEQSDDH